MQTTLSGFCYWPNHELPGILSQSSNTSRWHKEIIVAHQVCGCWFAVTMTSLLGDVANFEKLDDVIMAQLLQR